MVGSEPDVARQLGRYRLLARLGTGGMAEVFLARELGVAAAPPVAIKRMRRELSRTAEFVDLFLDEARIAARLQHPNVCRVLEIGTAAGESYLVLEYLQGVPLSHLMAHAELGAPGGLDLGVFAGLAIQACAGIQHAHDARDEHGAPLDLIHRDISPPNLFVTDEGVVKVLDFGISKSRASVVRTMTGQIRGKFSYMSPEHLRGEKLDRRSDVFSLGIVLTELIAGRRLFRRDNRLDVFRAIVKEPIPSLGALRPDLPRALVAVLDRALARDREARFERADALGDAIAEAVARSGGPAPPLEIAALLGDRFATELALRRRLLEAPADGPAPLGDDDPTQREPGHDEPTLEP